MLLIENVVCADGENITENASVLICEGKIVKVLSGTEPVECDITEVIHGEGKYLIPGFIDLHIHGFGGYSFMSDSLEEVSSALHLIAKHGTTSCLITTTCEPVEKMQKAIETAVECEKTNAGANVLGVHMEGPFINPKRGGANKDEYMCGCSVNTYKKIVGENEGFIRRVTLAPETDEGLELTKYLSEKGVCVSAGHTVASFELIKKSVDAGIKLCTHFFNGMEQMHHRNPGAVGAGLVDDRLFLEVICDLVHVDADMIRLVHKVKGVDYCAVVTDNITSSGLPDGEYYFDDEVIKIKEHICRDKKDDLAGSWMPMDGHFRNLINKVGLGLSDAVKMTSSTPARIIGYSDRKGYIKAGYDADLNLVDKDLNIIHTLINGKVI